MKDKLFGRTRYMLVVLYLLGLVDGNGQMRALTPMVLMGDPELLDLFTQTCSAAYIYLSGALSWEESFEKVGLETVLQVVEAHLTRLCSKAISYREFLHLVVLHVRESGFDVHFVLSRIHLPSGLQFPHYADTKFDRQHARVLRLFQNYSCGWSDCEDPGRGRLVNEPPFFIKGEQRKTAKELGAIAELIACSGKVKDCNGLAEDLRELGYPTVVTEKGFDITYDGKEYKLSGPIFRPGTYTEIIPRARRASGQARPD